MNFNKQNVFGIFTALTVVLTTSYCIQIENLSDQNKNAVMDDTTKVTIINKSVQVEKLSNNAMCSGWTQTTTVNLNKINQRCIFNNYKVDCAQPAKPGTKMITSCPDAGSKLINGPAEIVCGKDFKWNGNNDYLNFECTKVINNDGLLPGKIILKRSNMVNDITNWDGEKGNIFINNNVVTGKSKATKGIKPNQTAMPSKSDQLTKLSESDISGLTELTGQPSMPIGLWSVSGNGEESLNQNTFNEWYKKIISKHQNNAAKFQNKNKQPIIQFINYGNIGGEANVTINYLDSKSMTKSRYATNQVDLIYGQSQNVGGSVNVDVMYDKSIPYDEANKTLVKIFNNGNIGGNLNVKMECHESIFKNNIKNTVILFTNFNNIGGSANIKINYDKNTFLQNKKNTIIIIENHGPIGGNFNANIYYDESATPKKNGCIEIVNFGTIGGDASINMNHVSGSVLKFDNNQIIRLFNSKTIDGPINIKFNYEQ